MSPARIPDGGGPDDDGACYVFDDAGDLAYAVNIAIATGRPLLVRGPSGCGKSSLAKAVASRLGWALETFVVTSTTQWRDLCWRYDAVARLADAQIPALRKRASQARNYVQPSVLWNAFNRVAGASGVVVLIDEIDKAEPNVPNDLLVPIGARKFFVEETGQKVSFRGVGDDPRTPFGPMLLLITDNEERELPPAFLRRCIVYRIDQPTTAHLLRVAEARFGSDVAARPATSRLAEAFVAPTVDNEAPAGSVAEFIDAVRAVGVLGEAHAAQSVDRVLRFVRVDKSGGRGGG